MAVVGKIIKYNNTENYLITVTANEPGVGVVARVVFKLDVQ